MLTDSHCHLFYDEIQNDIENIFDRSKQLGVNRFICVGTNIHDSAQSLDIAEKYDNVFCSAGVHPHDAKDVGGHIGNFLNLKIFPTRLLAFVTSSLVLFVAIRMGIKLFF